MSFTKRYTGFRGELGKYLLYGGDTLDFHLDQNYPRLEFKGVIDNLWRDVDAFSETKTDKLFAIDTVLYLLRQDLMYSCMSDGIYVSKETLFSALNIPKEYKDAKGNEIVLKDNTETIKIDLARTCTLVKPWSTYRYITNVSERNKTGVGFQYKENNHEVYYFPTLQVAIVENGNHSIASGVLYRPKVLVEAQKINDTLLLESVCTDGAFWYNRYDESCIGGFKGLHDDIKPVSNFISLKFAVLFEVTQRKCKLLKEK